MKKETKDTTQVGQAIVAMADSLRKTFKNYTRYTREKAWKKLTTEKGEKEIKKILQDPNRPLSQFKQLQFAEWLNTNTSQYEPTL